MRGTGVVVFFFWGLVWCEWGVGCLTIGVDGWMDDGYTRERSACYDHVYMSLPRGAIGWGAKFGRWSGWMGKGIGSLLYSLYFTSMSILSCRTRFGLSASYYHCSGALFGTMDGIGLGREEL